MKKDNFLKCLDCNGLGEVSTMQSVYPGTRDSHIQAFVGTNKCENCNGTGLEPDQDIVKERIYESLTIEQENKLKDEHSKHYTGVDDDMSDKFESWLLQLTLEDLMKTI